MAAVEHLCDSALGRRGEVRSGVPGQSQLCTEFKATYSDSRKQKQKRTITELAKPEDTEAMGLAGSGGKKA